MSDLDDAFDVSDEATGLPPLDDGGLTVLVLKGGSSSGLVMLPNTEKGATEPIEVVYLHVRGLMSDSPTSQIEWVQTTLAVPTQIVPAIIEQLQGHLK